MTKSWIASYDVIWRLCDEPELMVQQVFLNVTVINCMEHIGRMLSQRNILRYSVICLFQCTMDLNFGHTIDIELKLVSLLIEPLLWPQKIGKVILQYCLQFYSKFVPFFIEFIR